MTKIKKQLILIHGWGMNKAIWHQLEQSLKDDIDIVSIDLPGYGQSAMQSNKKFQSHSLASIAKHVSPHLKKAQQNIILGWSLGGLIAIELAKLYPQWVAQLILVASNPKFIQSEDWPYAVDKQVFINFSNLLKQDIKKTIKRFIAIQAMGSESVREDIKIIQQLIEQSPYADYDTLSNGLELLLNSDLRQPLLSLGLPILMVVGSRDNLVNAKGLEFLRGQQAYGQQRHQPKNISVQVIAGAGHAPFISHFKQFQRIIRTALNL